jgi:MFS family permease
VGGVGFAVGISVGALLAAEMLGVAVSGLALSASVVGSALLAVPATRLVRTSGRRASLAMAYLVGTVGAGAVVAASVTRSTPLLFLGFFLFGGGSTAGLQARYAAVDLAPAGVRARHLSLIVWATTLGAVAGPNVAPLAGAALEGFGVPVLAGPFFFSSLLFVAAVLVLLSFLRPDPAALARASMAPLQGPRDSHKHGMRDALRAVWERPAARLGIIATAVGHLVMVGVMAMAPVLVMSAGHAASTTLRIVGVVLSVHVAGMYALAPLSGWLTDRLGRRSVIVGGATLLVAACAVAGTSGHGSVQLGAGLWLLGLGWSGTMVAGSTLLSESIPSELRTSAQGLSDLTMGLAGASSGALSGVIAEWGGYGTLTLVGALAALPLIAITLATGRGDSR